MDLDGLQCLAGVWHMLEESSAFQPGQEIIHNNFHGNWEWFGNGVRSTLRPEEFQGKQTYLWWEAFSPITQDYYLILPGAIFEVNVKGPTLINLEGYQNFVFACWDYWYFMLGEIHIYPTYALGEGLFTITVQEEISVWWESWRKHPSSQPVWGESNFIDCCASSVTQLKNKQQS